MAFLSAYAHTLNVTAAAKVAGIGRETHYEWMKVDPTYPERFDAARVQAVKRAEAEAYRRAVDGVERHRVVGGELVADPRDPTGNTFLMERVYSDDLLKTVLRAHDERYREKADVRHSGPGGGPIVVGQITDELRQATAKAMSDPKVRDAMMLVGEAMGQATFPAPGSAPAESIDGGTGES